MHVVVVVDQLVLLDRARVERALLVPVTTYVTTLKKAQGKVLVL